MSATVRAMETAAHPTGHVMETELWQNRRLLRSFVRRELHTRFAGSAIGVYWSIIHPLLVLLLYIVVFSTLVKGGRFSLHGHVVNYALFLCPALLAWNWFTESMSGACNSIVQNGAMIKKVQFPTAILPVSPLISGIVPFAVTMGVFLVFALFAGEVTIQTWPLIPAIALLQFWLMSGLAYALAALNVFIRDTSHLVVAGLQFLFWGSPIVYSRETLEVPLPWMRWWFEANPITHLVSAYREVILIGRLPQLGSFLYLVFFATICYHLGRTLFERTRRNFADEV